MDRRDGDADSPVGAWMHTSASDIDIEGSVSAARTNPSSPRGFLRGGSPQMRNTPWVQVQDRLLKFAEEGDEDVDACGEIVSCQIAIERSERPPVCHRLLRTPSMSTQGSNHASY